MEIDQFKKQLDWLDEERRKDKLLIATLQDRIADLEEHLPPVDQRLGGLEGELAHIATSLTRFEQIENTIGQMRVEFARQVQDVEKARAERDREMEKVRLGDMELVNRNVGEIRKGLEPIPDFKKTLLARQEGENRLGTEIEELATRLTATRRTDEEYRRQIKLLDEGQRQDAKRLTDLQGEVSAIRKRIEEQRGKTDLYTDSMRKIELRISEILAGETERRQGQVAFMEKQNLAMMERDRVWRDWQSRFEQVESQSLNLDSQLQSLDATHRAVKRSQETFDEISARFERRINEITEMQRLIEERFRQEWVSFKADDQKRWTNYTLAQEEQNRELNRQFGKSEERLVLLEDQVQEIQDLMHQMTEETQKRLNALLGMARDWAEKHDQTLPRGR
jgi:predicted  nucleic acid-binding Zn-ribbon protein